MAVASAMAAASAKAEASATAEALDTAEALHTAEASGTAKALDTAEALAMGRRTISRPARASMGRHLVISVPRRAFTAAGMVVFAVTFTAAAVGIGAVIRASIRRSAAMRAGL